MVQPNRLKLGERLQLKRNGEREEKKRKKEKKKGTHYGEKKRRKGNLGIYYDLFLFSLRIELEGCQSVLVLFNNQTRTGPLELFSPERADTVARRLPVCASANKQPKLTLLRSRVLRVCIDSTDTLRCISLDMLLRSCALWDLTFCK